VAKKWRLLVDRTAAVLTTQRIAVQFSSPRAEPSCRVMGGKAAWMGTSKMQRAGGAVVSTGAHNIKTEGPGTDKARVLVADMMVDTVLLAVKA
jgi:hypothetical protein